MKYRFVKRKAFESLDKYEQRLNQETMAGWRVVSMAHDGHVLVALLERIQNL